ncbi:BadF/BadG/BcrA/BcrD ATPase family protein [Brevibacillus sp. FSL K6-0770]|uniref:N-acetylglucosamine kinase n=1 Tax=Brevibacillus TaxID=55080 RepID=UPI002853048D|nr:BadF/BadG/BcrA/BcrD ATPase family protein [Brevibacillus parabrevis]MDR5000354.1 BadF/BadG/BcrA/BcrD ATPase family protein [Brevibacillus parabrevis]
MLSNDEKKWFIGIDGGGTKTKAAICDERGQVQTIATGDSSNPLSRPWAEVEATLKQLVTTVCQEARIRDEEVSGLFIGLGGADRPFVREKIDAAFAEAWQERLFFDNDVIPALYSGTWGQPGIVLISGTGSIACALTSEGVRHRVGGWGYLLGDEGSGFDLGKKAAAAVLRAHDGRGEPTVLTELFLAHYHVSSQEELIAFIYGDDNPRMQLARASELVEQAARQKDRLANGLIREAAAALCELAHACLKKTQEALPVVLAGGVLAQDTLVRQRVLAEASFPVVIPEVSPVIGALVAAMTRAGHRVDESVAEQLRESGTALEKR